MQAAPRKIHVPSLFQFALSGLGLLSTLPAALLLGLSGLAALFRGENSISVAPVFSLAVTALVIAVLLVPSGVLALLRLSGRPLPHIGVRGGRRYATALMLIWPLVVLAGWWVIQQGTLTGLILPFLQIFAIGIPVVWLVEVGRRNLPGGSAQRLWGLLDFSLLVSPAFILVLESVVLLALVVVFAIWVGTQPALSAELASLLEQLEAAGTDREAIVSLLLPYLQKPAVIYALMGLTAVIMPLLEEMFKPMALWFVAGRLRRPAEGFVGGLICGGAFAFVESLGYASSAADASWAVLVSARIGSALLHVVTSGLVGWGIALAVLQLRYLRLAGLYLLAVLMHGLWNFLGVLTGIASVFPGESAEIGKSLDSGVLVPAALVVLGVIFFAILVGVNRRLRLPESAPDAVQLHTS